MVGGCNEVVFKALSNLSLSVILEQQLEMSQGSCNSFYPPLGNEGSFWSIHETKGKDAPWKFKLSKFRGLQIDVFVCLSVYGSVMELVR